MPTPYHCPLCRDDYEEETGLRVHLEVEHRKSELARILVDEHAERSDPSVEGEARAPTV